MFPCLPEHQWLNPALHCLLWEKVEARPWQSETYNRIHQKEAGWGQGVGNPWKPGFRASVKVLSRVWPIHPGLLGIFPISALKAPYFESHLRFELGYLVISSQQPIVTGLAGIPEFCEVVQVFTSQSC